VSAEEIIYILDESNENSFDSNRINEIDQIFKNGSIPVIQKNNYLIDQDNSDDTLLDSVAASRSLFRIPNSQTQQLIVNKPTSN